MWFERLRSETATKLLDDLTESKKDQAANRVAGAIQARSEQIKSSTFSKLTELRQAGNNIPPIACSMGCNYCCHLQVHCYAPETIRIADHLRKTRTAKHLSSLVDKMRKHAKFRSGLTKKEQASGNVAPCPFLGKKGECTIYEVRPLVCRTYHTFNVKECENVWRNPEKKLTVTMVVEPTEARDALSWALEDACEELDIPVGEIELISGTLIALDNPEASKLWRNGVDLFAEAKV